MTFEQFLAVRLGALTRNALALTADAGLAEDILQEVLVKAARRWDRIGSLSAPEAYLRRMLVNEYLSWRRKWARIVPLDGVGVGSAGPSDLDVVDERDALRRRILNLPRRQQAAVALRYYADLDDAQIADALGCRPGTVRSLISRALAALRVDPVLRADLAAEHLSKE